MHGWTAIAGEARATVPGDRRDDAVGIDLPDPVAERVGYIQVPCRIDPQVLRRAEAGVDGRTSITGEAVLPSSRSCDRGDDAPSVDPADAVVADIEDVDVALRVHRDSPRMMELRRLCGAAVAGEPLGTGPSQGRDHPRGVHLADLVADRHIEISVRVEGHVPDDPQRGIRCRASVAGVADLARTGHRGDMARGSTRITWWLV